MGSNGILAGIKYSDNELLVAVTEKRTKKEIDDYLKLFTEVNNG
jgi:glycine cleavage system pyridoxal-binding protein P